MALLKVKAVTKRFGGLTAVNTVNMHVEKGEIVGLIGPNGAGKTTLFNCVAGYYPPDSGEITFDGQPITNMLADQTCRLGITRTWQIVKVLAKLTVQENVMIGAFLNNREVKTARKKADEILEFCGLTYIKDDLGGSLTIAEKKRVEVARALATDPELILLDEVMAGLTPKESQEAIEIVYKIRELGITILMIEHVMEIIMPISDRLIVLDQGCKIAEGTANEVAHDEEVIRAYLGVKR